MNCFVQAIEEAAPETVLLDTSIPLPDLVVTEFDRRGALTVRETTTIASLSTSFEFVVDNNQVQDGKPYDLHLATGKGVIALKLGNYVTLKMK